MPDPKNSGGSGLDNITDKLEELKGRHHLAKKNFEAYQQTTEAEKQENESRIRSLRQDNWNLRLHLRKLKNADEKDIRSAFNDNRSCRLKLQRNRAADAITTMDEEVMEEVKVLNKLKFERKKKEARLKELEKAYEEALDLRRASFKADEQTIGNLENSLDKVQIKFSTAQNINFRLGEIKDKLQQDALLMPGKLDLMEQTFLEHVAETDKLLEMNKTANAQRDETKSELLRVEFEVYQSRKRRETELAMIKKEVAKRKNEADKIEKRYQRTNILNESQDQKLQEEQEELKKRQQDILKYEDAIQRIIDSSNVANINEVVSHYKKQEASKEKMKIQLKDLQKMQKTLRKKIDGLNEEFRKLRYSGQGSSSRGQHELDDLDALVVQERERISEIAENFEREERVLSDVTQAVGALLHKFDDIKLSPPDHNFKTGEVMQQMDMLLKKGALIMKQIQIKKEEDIDVLSALPPEQFHQFLQHQANFDNVRVKLDKKESSLSGYHGFDYEGQDGGEHAPTRLEIKNDSQKLVTQKMGKKKKKEKQT